MRSLLKKPESVYDIIFKTVTENREAVLDSARTCKQLFKQKDNPADPNVLFELGEVLRARQDEEALAKHIDPSKQKNGPKTPDELKGPLKTKKEDYKCYIEDFLPALLQEIIQSQELGLEKIGQVLRITSGIVKQSSEEKYEHYIQFLDTLLGKIIGLSKLCKDKNEKKEKLQEIGKIISEIISGSNYQIDLRNSRIGGQDDAGTPPPSDGPGSRASSPVPSEKSPLPSPVSSRRGSISSVSSSVGGDDDPQKEETESQMRPKQDPEEKPKKQENENPDGQANPIGNGNPQKRNEDQPQPPKQPAKEEQNTQENKNSEPTKQPNNRNFRIALATGCAFSAIGCLIAGVVTLGMVGAGLLVMSVVLAIAAAVTRYLTPPSSELTSTDLSPLLDDGKQR